MRLLSRVSVVSVAATAIGALLAGPGGAPAFAYCSSGQRHQNHAAGFRPPYGFSSAFYPAIQSSLSAWNGLGNWTLSYVQPNFVGPLQDDMNYYSFRSYGYSDIPGQTSRWYSSSDPNLITSTSVALNSDFTWNTAGTMNQSQHQVDVRTVVTHELGHVIRLLHPDQCHATLSTAESGAVMEVTWTKKWTPNSDDIAGLRALQGT
jgi:hypothetical protein